MDHNVTVATPDLMVGTGLVQQGDVLEVTKEPAIIVGEKLVEMSVLVGIFVGLTVFHLHMEDVSLVQNY